MSRARAMRALEGGSASPAFGVTWVPVDAGREYLGLAGKPGAATVVTAVADELEADFAFVPAAEGWAAECSTELRARDIAVAWTVPGPLGIVAKRIGWTAAMKQSAAEPGQLAGLLAEALHETTDLVRAGGPAGADWVVLADDLASDSGWLVSPDFALSALLPCATHVAAQAQVQGLPSVYHSDGDIRALHAALHDGGFAGVHVAPPARVALEQVVADAGRHGLRVLGGVSAAELGAADVVATERIESLARDAGLMVCDDGGLTKAAELRALHVMFQGMRKATED